MKSVALHNLGCKVNAYEMDVMQQMLQQKGYGIVPFDETADIYIINTCTVTNIADRKSRQMLHRAKAKNPDAIVVAVGCYVQTGKDAAARDACIDLAIGNNKKKELVTILEAFLREREAGRGQELSGEDKTLHHSCIIDIAETKEYEEMTLQKTAGHTRAYIKIQDGCNQFCSYCIIPYARGRVRSRNEEDVLREVQGLAAAGYKEIVLTGIHISSYGADTAAREDYAAGSKLIGLIERIHETEGIERIRLGSLEPRIVTAETAERLAALPKVCPHFHLSLQSGCDATLKRMNRHYTTGEYYQCVENLRKVYDTPAITTDVIVGFPGETEEEYALTAAFLKKIGFYEMHVFKYSKRQGTRAADMENQIPEHVKACRSGELLEMEKRQSSGYRGAYIGKEAQVLFEDTKVIDGKVYHTGYTSQYVRVAAEADTDLSNCMRKGKLTGFLKEDILLMDLQS